MVKSNDFDAISCISASLWKRAYSNTIDFIGPLLVGLYGCVNPYFAILDWVVVIIMLGFGFMLSCVMWFVSMRRWGNTWGREWARIRIIDTRGNTPSLWKLAMREFLKLISLFTPLIIGLFWVFWDKNKQSWYDKVLKTYVVKCADVVNSSVEETGPEKTVQLKDLSEDLQEQDIVSTHPHSSPVVLSNRQVIPEISTIYIGFWLRFVSTIIDIIVIMAISIALAIPLSYYIAEGVILLPFFVPWIYYLLFSCIRRQTLGKMLIHIKVVSINDGRPGIWRVYLREFLGKLIFIIPLFIIISSTGYARLFCWGFIVVFLIGILWIVWDKRKQGWHDKITGTYVIKAQRQ